MAPLHAGHDAFDSSTLRERNLRRTASRDRTAVAILALAVNLPSTSSGRTATGMPLAQLEDLTHRERARPGLWNRRENPRGCHLRSPWV